VSCSAPHHYETLGILDHPPGPYPGDAAVEREADAFCLALLDDVADTRPDIADDLAYGIGLPADDEWAAGMRHVACFGGVGGNGAKTTGRLLA
jgi:hypothetical protein